MIEALQLGNAFDTIPEGVTIEVSASEDLEGKPIIATAETADGKIFIYPTDWVLYDMSGLIRGVMKDKNFKSMYEKLGDE